MNSKNMSEDSFPKAYKEGHAEFFGRDFLVTTDVLIPRPETETMVEMVLSLAGKSYLPGMSVEKSKLPENPRILEVGTGSGCVAVTLALEIPEAKVFACDVSEKALKVAKENAEKHKTDVEFRKSDLLSAYQISDKFDVVVANLPYVSRDWEWLNEPESKAIEYEPEVALFAEDDGLELVNRLLDEIDGRAEYLILEADPCQHERITSRAEARGYKLLKISGFQSLFVFDKC